MTIAFGSPYQVIRRGAGYYVDGEYFAAPESPPQTVILNIQPASTGDYERLASEPGGRRYASMLRAYADAGLDLVVAGDGPIAGAIVIVGGDRYLVVGKSQWRVIPGAPTNHTRYLLAREAEAAQGEALA